MKDISLIVFTTISKETFIKFIYSFNIKTFIIKKKFYKKEKYILEVIIMLHKLIYFIFNNFISYKNEQRRFF